MPRGSLPFRWFSGGALADLAVGFLIGFLVVL